MPYGQTEVPVRIPDDNFYRILEPPKPVGAQDTASLIEEALDSPFGDFSLTRMVRPGSTAGILVDPVVPPEARRQVIQSLRSRLERAGVSETKVFVRKRLSNTPPPEAPNREDSFKLLDPSQGSFKEIGKTSLGTSVSVQEELLSCGVRIVVGLVLPHFATGFTGGPEMVIPGSSSIQSIAKNRSLLMKGFSTPLSTEENPVLSDSLEAYKLAGPFYSVCFVPDGWGGIHSAFTGELESVFREASARYLQVHSPKINRRSDIVVVSAGQLLGMDLYHCVRVLSNAFSAIKKGGTIILVSECSKGVGASIFLDYAKRFSERKGLATELRYRFKLGGHVNLFLQDVLEKYRVQLVSVLPDLYTRGSFGLKPSRTASEAIQKAVRIEGKDSKILIVNRGDITVPVFESS